MDHAGRSNLCALVLLLTLAHGVGACGGNDPGPGRDAAPQPMDSGGAEPDARATEPDAPAIDAPRMDAPAAPPDAFRSDAPRPDAGPLVEANIQEVLACGTPLGVAGMANAGDLQLHQVDTGLFPDALCNDGTPAVVYYRPYRGEANRNRWAITLRGGGSCDGAENCAARWCSCSGADPCDHTEIRTNFTLNNMSGGGRRGNPGLGIHSRDATRDNPIADYNHVQFVYCSSDAWRGNARGVAFTTTHPRTGVEVTYLMHFLGARILEANLTTLRQDGVPALRYTVGGADVPMPDLDEATEVLLAGDSAGGAGIIHNLDRVAAILRAGHVGGSGPVVHGLIDAVMGPAWDRLDWSMTPGASAGVDTYPEVMDFLGTLVVNATGRPDESCVAYHTPMGDPSVCFDESHVVRHHITTPFFVRMALLDGLISDFYESVDLADPDLGPFVDSPMGVPVNFALVLQRELAAFPMLPSTAEEGAMMTVAPGVFAPACSNHDTIHEDTEVYGVTIDPGSGPLYLFDVLEPWRTGGTPTAALTTDMMRRDTVCPPPVTP